MVTSLLSGGAYKLDKSKDPFNIIEKNGGIKKMKMNNDSAQWKLKSANDKACNFIAK